MQKYQYDNKLIIKFKFNNPFLYEEFETSILDILRDIFIVKKKQQYEYNIVFNLNFYLDKKYINIILLYPFIPKDFSFKDIYKL